MQEDNAEPKSASPYSCKRFVCYAGLILLLFALAHICGLRSYTSSLSGTGSSGHYHDTLGMGYALLYIAALTIAPVLLIASIILKLFQKFFTKKRL